MFYQKERVFFRSGLLDLIHTWNKDVGQFYEDRINEQKKAYSERQDTFILWDLLLLSIMNIWHVVYISLIYYSLIHSSWSKVMHYITEVHEPISQQRIHALESSKEKVRTELGLDRKRV